MHRASWIVGAILIVVGLVWVGQGLGLLPGSFMSGDRFWAVVGAGAVAAGAALLGWRRLPGRGRPG